MKKKIHIDLNDIAIVAGLILLCKGLYMLYPPVMYITAGGILLRIGQPRDEKAVRK